MRTLAALPLLALLALSACSTYRDDLARGQIAFEQNNHERALAIFRVLEPDTAQLTTQERAHYAYLRGMTDYRIGYRSDARHWLMIAKAIEGEMPGTLPSDWRTRMTYALTELNGVVYTTGIDSLTNSTSAKAKAEEPAATPKKKNED